MEQGTNKNYDMSDERTGETVSLLIQEPQIFTFLCSCFFISVVCYILCALQGKIRDRTHNGLKLFWEVMMYSEIISTGLCLFYLAFLYYLDIGDKYQMVCAYAALPFSREVLMAYGWLMIWLIFSVSVLRAVTAITWLHQLRTVEQLKDMGRGIGILAVTLLYLFPLALLCRHNGAVVSSEVDVQPSVCLPVWFVLLSPRSEGFVITAGYAIGMLIAGVRGMLSQCKKKSLLAIPIGLVTHFIPTYLFCLWANSALRSMEVSVSMTLIYCVVASVNSISNLFCYKLLPMASQQDNDVTGTEEIQNKKHPGRSDEPLLKA